MTGSDEPPPASLDDLRARAAADVSGLERELAEIDLLLQQARAEAGRHETKRAAAAARLETASTDASGGVGEAVALGAQVATLTKRAALMDTQVEVLEGKVKVLRRYREALVAIVEALEVASETASAAAVGPDADSTEAAVADGDDRATLSPAVARVVLAVQEDLRREISRAMHDGPAQSLTNIVLQAQIVDRLVTRDPERARDEVRQLVAMVQQTLEATKTFIFDVRPMVLDDLGLVATLRGAARDRGRRARTAVEFESFGLDVRLPMELETGLFRLLDETLAGFLSSAPERVMIRLDWSDTMTATVTAERGATAANAAEAGRASDVAARDDRARGRRGKDPDGRDPGGKDRSEPLPEILRTMIEERDLASAMAAAEVARKSAWVPMPSATWREITERAKTLGIHAELSAEGMGVRIVADLPGAPVAAPPAVSAG
ncbi:MAG: sensor histidine kinase [Candidatus Limnocylindrales bacterium]